MGAVRDELEIPPPMPSMSPASYRTPRRREAMDPNTRRLALIAGGIGGLLVLLVGAWSVVGHHHGGIPVVEPEAGPVKVKPANPGGMSVAGQNEEILSGGSTTGAAAIAPAPETPDPQALKAAEQPRPAAPSAAAGGQTAAAVASPVQATATAEPKPAPVRPAPAARANPAPAGRGAQVQLAALGSEHLALIEWHRLEHKLPALLNGRRPEVTRIEHDGRTFWRLRTGGFASVADASSFCDKLKAKGAGCAVAAF